MGNGRGRRFSRDILKYQKRLGSYRRRLFPSGCLGACIDLPFFLINILSSAYHCRCSDRQIVFPLDDIPKQVLGNFRNSLFFRSKIADFYCFSVEKRQLERRASMLNARTTHAFHIFDDKILGKSLPIHRHWSHTVVLLAIGGFDDDGNGMLSIESYDIHADQWSILTLIPGAISKTWPQSLGTVHRRLYISVFHTTNTFIVMQEGYFFDLDTEEWIKAPVIHDRARYCPTVQLRFPKNMLKSLRAGLSQSTPLSIDLFQITPWLISAERAYPIFSVLLLSFRVAPHEQRIF